MKYYRLTFRSQDRLTASSWSQPQFVLDLPSNTFGNTRGGTCKVVFEQFSGYEDKDDGREILCLSFKNEYSQNSQQTLGERDYGASSGISFIPYLQPSKTGATWLFFKENKYPAEEKGMIMPCSTFNKGILQFDIKHLNGTAYTQPSTANFQYYTICLGVYVDED